MTESKNENDHFDLDHFDHIFGESAHAQHSSCKHGSTPD